MQVKLQKKSGLGLKSNLHKLEMPIITVWVRILDGAFSNLLLSERSGPSCSKHCSLRSSLSGQLVLVFYNFITKYTEIFSF